MGKQFLQKCDAKKNVQVYPAAFLGFFHFITLFKINIEENKSPINGTLVKLKNEILGDDRSSAKWRFLMDENVFKVQL